MTTRYQRVVIKLSGGALAGSEPVGLDARALEHVAAQVLSTAATGVQVAVVVGGGNFFRGSLAEQWGIDRAEADSIGMLGTVMNSLMLRGVLKAKGDREVRVMTALPIPAVAEPFIRLCASRTSRAPSAVSARGHQVRLTNTCSGAPAHAPAAGVVGAGRPAGESHRTREG